VPLARDDEVDYLRLHKNLHYQFYNLTDGALIEVFSFSPKAKDFAPDEFNRFELNMSVRRY